MESDTTWQQPNFSIQVVEKLFQVLMIPDWNKLSPLIVSTFKVGTKSHQNELKHDHFIKWLSNIPNIRLYSTFSKTTKATMTPHKLIRFHLAQQWKCHHICLLLSFPTIRSIVHKDCSQLYSTTYFFFLKNVVFR